MKPYAALLALALSTSVVQADTIVVSQFLQSFQPQDVVINEGDTVMWIWSSGSHTTTEGFDTAVDPTDAWSSVLSGANQSFSVTFDASLLATFPRLATAMTTFASRTRRPDKSAR